MTKKTYRRIKPNDFIARVQLGYDFLQMTLNNASKAEIDYRLKRESISLGTAREYMRYAKRLLPDRSEFSTSALHYTARLQIPCKVLLRACSEDVTDAQLQEFLNMFTIDTIVDQDRAYEILYEIIRPTQRDLPPLQLEILPKESKLSLKIMEIGTA